MSKFESLWRFNPTIKTVRSLLYSSPPSMKQRSISLHRTCTPLSLQPRCREVPNRHLIGRSLLGRGPAPSFQSQLHTSQPALNPLFALAAAVVVQIIRCEAILITSSACPSRSQHPPGPRQPSRHSAMRQVSTPAGKLCERHRAQDSRR